VRPFQLALFSFDGKTFAAKPFFFYFEYFHCAKVSQQGGSSLAPLLFVEQSTISLTSFFQPIPRTPLRVVSLDLLCQYLFIDAERVVAPSPNECTGNLFLLQLDVSFLDLSHHFPLCDCACGTVSEIFSF